MANLIAAGTTEVASADFTLTAGGTSTLCINTASATLSLPSDAGALIQYKNAGAYSTIGRLTSAQQCLVLNAPGTFRVVRQACSANVAVDRD